MKNTLKKNEQDPKRYAYTICRALTTLNHAGIRTDPDDVNGCSKNHYAVLARPKYAKYVALGLTMLSHAKPNLLTDENRSLLIANAPFSIKITDEIRKNFPNGSLTQKDFVAIITKICQNQNEIPPIIDTPNLFRSKTSTERLTNIPEEQQTLLSQTYRN